MSKVRLIITSIISIVLVSILLLGSTYSIFTSEDIAEDANVYTTGNLNITYKLDSSNVKLTDVTPMTEEEADSVKPYRITVTNNGNVPYKFNVILSDTTASNVINYDYIMTKVGYLEANSLSSCTDNVIVGDVILLAGTSVDIDVRIWLDKSLPNTEMGKSFYAKLSIDGLAIYDNSDYIDNSNLSLRYMNTSSTSDFRSDTYRTYIKNAAFVDYIDTSNASVDSTTNEKIMWDMSTKQDNSVIAWLEPNTEEGYYDLYIGSKNKIYAKSLRLFFENMTALQTVILNNLDTSLTTDMRSLLTGCSSLISLDLSNFDTSNVTAMYYMFRYCSSLTSLDLSNFDTSKVTDMSRMFQGCNSLTNLDVSNFDTSNVTHMNLMFNGCYNLAVLDISNFDTSAVTNMEGMFYGCSSLANLDLSSFDTSNVTNMGSMIHGCRSLTSLDLSNFDTSNVTAMYYMFRGCTNLVNLNLSSFDTSNVITMEYMFFDCSSLTSLDLSDWDTSNVTSMNQMFYNCSSLTSLDVSNFDTSKVTNMNNMFQGCKKLITTITIRNSSTTYTNMFYGASNSSGSKITVNYTSATSSLVDNMILTKSNNSNVVKGSLVV